MVPLSRTLPVEKDFTKLRSWARVGFHLEGEGVHKQRQVWQRRDVNALCLGPGEKPGAAGVQGDRTGI